MSRHNPRTSSVSIASLPAVPGGGKLLRLNVTTESAVVSALELVVNIADIEDAVISTEVRIMAEILLMAQLLLRSSR